MTKSLLAVTFCLFAISVSAPAFSFRLPPCFVSDEEKSKPAEDILSGYRTELDNLVESVNIGRLEEHRRNSKIRLTRDERKIAKRYDALIVKIGFWEEACRLKDALVGLHGTNPSAKVVAEADDISKAVIETLYELSQKWRIGNSALFTNFLINTGLKEKGFCYHYVANLRQVLSKQIWNRFEISWGAAWENTFRENNALVITAKGQHFEDGLAVDAWRTAGRPFWTPVKGDRFPWVEVHDVEARYNVE